MAKKYKKRYDRDKKEYVYSKNDEEVFRVFRTGLGGQIEWTGKTKYTGFGFNTLRNAVLDMMGWDDFKEWMKGRKRA